MATHSPVWASRFFWASLGAYVELQAVMVMFPTVHTRDDFKLTRLISTQGGDAGLLHCLGEVRLPQGDADAFS